MAEAKKKTTAAKAAKTEPEVVPAVAEPKAETVEKKEEVKAIIKMIEELTNEEKEFVNALLKEINKKKDKISN